MNRIFIVGGDGLASEVYSYIDRMMQAGEKIQFGGFLGHNGYGNPENHKEYKELYVCDVDDFVFEENDCAVIGVAKPAIRKSIYTYLKNRGVKMPNIIDPSCILFPHSVLGDGNILAIRTLISTNVHIGNGNLFNGGVEVGHDAIIGDFNFISPNVRVLGKVKVGNANIIATSSVLLPKSRIGNENTIVPMSVVYKGCGNNCYMSGNPAVKVNKLMIIGATIMTEKEFLSEVQELLQTDEVLSMNTHLPSLADWDSLSIMAMMAFLERNFGAKTTMADYKNIKDLREIVKMANITL